MTAPVTAPAAAGEASAEAPAPVRLSVCIPAYNRAAELVPLLDSIFAQDYPHFDVVICEDHSRERPQIRAVVERYQALHPGRILYSENAENLGFDANFREMVRRATGDYCFIMGNDDLVAPGAFAAVAEALGRSPGVGVILRSFAWFRGSPDTLYTVSRYYPDELLFPPGPDTVVLFYRRSVVMSGLVLHRGEALTLETDRFDGTLFYQLHLIAHTLMRRPGLFLPQVLAYYRTGGTPEFGSSAAERGRFTPGGIDAEAGIRFLEGLLAIAAHVDALHGTDVRARVERDLGRHMYPTFAQYSDEPLRVYARLYRDLCAMGFWRYPLFHAYGLAVGLLGRRRIDRVVHAARRRLGYTPSLGERPRHAVVVRPAEALRG